MNIRPKVSVIVPIYNSASSLEKCLDSIKNQTFKNIEVIMVNDGSTDNSKDVCLRYIKTDLRFKYLEQENKGKSSAVNVGYKIATGEFVSFIDSDDFIEPSLYETTLALAEKHQVDIVNYSYYYIKNGKKEKNSLPFPKNTIISNKEFLLLLKNKFPDKHKLFWFTAMNLIRKDLIDEHSICHDESVKIGIDTIFNLECYINAQGIYSINDAFYNYVYNSNSITQKSYKSDLLERLSYQFCTKKNIYKKYNLFDDAIKKDLANYYIEHSLIFLINNEINSNHGLTKTKLRDIRNSDLYQYCFKNYKRTSKNLTKKTQITIYLMQIKQFGLLCFIKNVFRIKK